MTSCACAYNSTTEYIIMQHWVQFSSLCSCCLLPIIVLLQLSLWEIRDTHKATVHLAKGLTVQGYTRPATNQPLTIKADFSSGVWKRPWPNLEDVSMNFSVTSSLYLRLKFTNSDCSDAMTQSHTYTHTLPTQSPHTVHTHM